MLLPREEAWRGGRAVEVVRGAPEEGEDKVEAVRVELCGLGQRNSQIHNGSWRTYVDAIQLLILAILVAIVAERHALAREDEAVRKEAEENRLGEVHDRLTVDGEAPTAEVELQPSEQLRLETKVWCGRMLGDLSDWRRGCWS